MIMKDRTTIREREERLRWEKFQVFYRIYNSDSGFTLLCCAMCAAEAGEKNEEKKAAFTSLPTFNWIEYEKNASLA